MEAWCPLREWLFTSERFTAIAIDSAGVANNTLVEFTNDNGSWRQISQEFGEGPFLE
jgi:hypothetical protein